MINPFIDTLEWLTKDHWLWGSQFEEDQKYSLQAIIYNMDIKVRHNHQNLYICIDHGIIKLYLDRVLGKTSPIFALNNHPDTTFEDIQKVLIEAGEYWRDRYSERT